MVLERRNYRLILPIVFYSMNLSSVNIKDVRDEISIESETVLGASSLLHVAGYVPVDVVLAFLILLPANQAVLVIIISKFHLLGVNRQRA